MVGPDERLGHRLVELGRDAVAELEMGQGLDEHRVLPDGMPASSAAARIASATWPRPEATSDGAVSPFR